MSDSKLSPDKSLLSTAIAAYERQFKATGSINVTGESAAWLLGELRRSSLSATEQTFSSDPAEVREFNQGFEAFGKGVRYTDLPDLPTDTNGIGWAWAWFLKNRPDRTAPSHAAEPIPNISERMERLIHMAATMTTNNEAYKTTQLAQELLEGRRSLLAGALEGGSPIRSPATQTQGAPALAAGDAARPSTEQTGRIPALEQTRINADYWLNEARGKYEEGRGEPLLCAEQAINAWKNAAYAAHDQLAAVSNGREPVSPAGDKEPISPQRDNSAPTPMPWTDAELADLLGLGRQRAAARPALSIWTGKSGFSG